ncbi:MAG: VanZ family protein [Verrucomicrobiales bacterium]|nr:VanZ family protein [Verrucomicrobiales bacterium]
MALIFVASADTESGYRGSRILAPIIRWFVPDISAGDLERCVLWARKGVHFATFAALAALVFRALAGRAVHDRPGRIAIRAWAIATVYAASDELHQSFVPSRVGSITDVLIDAAGAAAAVAVLARLRPRRPES